MVIQYDDCFLFRAHECLLVWGARCYLSVSDCAILHAQRLGAVLLRGRRAGLSWDCQVTGHHQHQEGREHPHVGCHHSNYHSISLSPQTLKSDPVIPDYLLSVFTFDRPWCCPLTAEITALSLSVLRVSAQAQAATGRRSHHVSSRASRGVLSEKILKQLSVSLLARWHYSF